MDVAILYFYTPPANFCFEIFAAKITFLRVNNATGGALWCRRDNRHRAGFLTFRLSGLCLINAGGLMAAQGFRDRQFLLIFVVLAKPLSSGTAGSSPPFRCQGIGGVQASWRTLGAGANELASVFYWRCGSAQSARTGHPVLPTIFWQGNAPPNL